MSAEEHALEDDTQKVIDRFAGLAPSADAVPDSVVVRNENGDIVGVYVRSTTPDVETMEGALAFRVSAADERIQFCNDEKAIRNFLRTPKVTRSATPPPNPAKDDIWISEE